MVRISGLAFMLALIQVSFAAQLQTCESESCSSSSAGADVTTLLQYNAKSEENQALDSTEGEDEEEEEGEDIIEDGDEYRKEGSTDDDDEEEEDNEEEDTGDNNTSASLLQSSRRRFLVKQCVKNQALATMKLRTFNKKGEKMSVIHNFMWLQEFCHKSKSANNFRTFVLEPKGCKVAQHLAQGLVIGGVVLGFTTAAILSAGGCAAACGSYLAVSQVAGLAIEGFLFAAHGEIMDALMSLAKKNFEDGIVMIPSNMKDGGKESAVTGDCIEGVIPGRMGSW